MIQNHPFIVLLVVAFGSVLLGSSVANALRMKEIGWKFTVIILSLALAAIVLLFGKPSLGIDLRGGDILIYEVDVERTAQALATDPTASPEAKSPRHESSPPIDMGMLIQSLQRRINPGGVREVVIREYGTNQVEIIIPEVSESEIDTIKDSIRKTGYLKFRIVADKARHPVEWSLAEKQMASDDDDVRLDTVVRDGDRIVGEWVRLAREEVTTPGVLPPYKIDVKLVQDSMLWRELVPDQIEVLTVVDHEYGVDGSDLADVHLGSDEFGGPAVSFAMNSEGSVKMGRLTGSNLPDPQTGNQAKLGIILDNELMTCPGIKSQISSQGIIEGRFTQREVETLIRILRDGKMPAVLFPDPISENNISPLLGVDTIRKGAWAIGVSLGLVILFMLWYYRFAGIVACFALITNLVLTIAIMYLISASFTLPGIAGLVLTVGMSVDANVLIYERIREELSRGASLRMAIRNGFDRATTTIIDANVTTVLVGLVLYVIGTADLRGFAVTLIIGIFMSMFTAIFCSRVFFDVAERKRWLRQLRFVTLFGETRIGFLRMGPPAIVGSLILIGLGMVGVYYRGAKLFDIDFLGGTSVQIVLKEPHPIEQVRAKLRPIAEDVWVTQINPQGRTPNTVFKVDTSLQDQDELHDRIQSAMMDDSGQSLLELRTMTFTAIEPVTAEESVTKQAAAPRSNPPVRHVSALGIPSLWSWTPYSLVMQVEDPAETTAPDEPSQETTKTQETSDSDLELQPGATSPGPATEISPGPESDSTSVIPATPSTTAFRSRTQLKFQEKISARTLQRLVDHAAQQLRVTAPRVKLSHDQWDGRSDTGYQEWDAQFSSDKAETETLLKKMQEDISELPIWLSSSKIGGKIAGNMRWKAVEAILFSFVAIVAYIWFRFRSVAHGLAAVVALIHDVLVTLGLIALSLWLSRAAGFLLIDEFKISLPIVAAFLTLIGYSLNDTIVIFDRIREIKGKSPHLTEAMIDTSINQTLSRTFLTSFTTLVVVIVLYVFGGEGIHGFAFALLVGVVAGTYSTVFIASPVLIRLLNWWRSRQDAQKKTEMVTAR